MIEFYPPNSPPVISQIDPGDGEINVPLSLSELRFQISDVNGELMSYTVTTSPDIGSGSGNLKPDGVYSVPISGLEDLTEYSWHIEVTDGMDTTIGDFSFTTEAIAPIVSNPFPQDDERYVPVSLPHLSFYLKDFQGDPMDYTVETVPDIGSDSATGVGEGTYSIPVSGLDYSREYTWYVNATDGEHQTNKIFNFQTEHKMTFDPFTDGWQYRKEITIDHTKVDGDLENFPILISTSDVDLRDKAQDDGDDILFMDGAGVANRLYHEIELFESTTGEFVAWVNVTSISSSTDTVISMYYGNSGVADQQNAPGTWDSHFKMVHHFQETSGNPSDSTSNSNDLTTVGDADLNSEGIANGDAYIDGTDGRFYDSDGPSFFDSSVPALTCSIWYNQDSGGTGAVYDLFNTAYAQRPYGGFTYAPDTNGDESINIYDTAGSTWRRISITNISTGWHNVVFTVDGTDANGYLNGSFENDVTLSGNLNMGYGGNAIEIGRSGNSDTNYYEGHLDEFRISDITRSPDWINASYNTMSSPSNFLSIGPEVAAP
jgi:hypothetical protein